MSDSTRTLLPSSRRASPNLRISVLIAPASSGYLEAPVCRGAGEYDQEDLVRGALIRTAHRVGYAFSASLDALPASPAAVAPTVTCWIVFENRRIPLQAGANAIGRDPGSAVWVDVAGVSRRHAQIVLESGTASIEDSGSKNGTFVRGREVHGRVALRDGDWIHLVTEVLTFRSSARGVSTATQKVPRLSEDDADS